MSEFTFTVDDVVRESAAKDYMPTRSEPKTGVFYEWKVTSAKLDVAKKGYLQLSLQCAALNKDGGAMFTKYMNIALPVAFKGVTPFKEARAIFKDTVTALHADWSIYDTVSEDAATGKKIYLKNGVEIKGAAYTAAQKAQADNLVQLETALTTPGSSTEAVNSLVGRTFFARIEQDKTGQYTNIKGLLSHTPSKDPVVYDPKEAFGG